MKETLGALGAAVLLLGPSAHCAQPTFRFDGVVTEVAMGPGADNSYSSVSVGTRFEHYLFLSEPLGPPTSQPDPNTGRYEFSRFPESHGNVLEAFTFFRTPGVTIVTGWGQGIEIEVRNSDASQGGDQISFSSGGGVTRWLLSDYSGQALTSVNFPTEWKLEDWPDQHWLEINRPSVRIRGEFTNLAVVPDAASTMALVPFALAVLAICRRFLLVTP